MKDTIEKSGEAEPGVVDIMAWLGRATLDVVGLAGFDYEFDSLALKDNELSKAFKEMLAASQSDPLKSLETAFSFFSFFFSVSPVIFCILD